MDQVDYDCERLQLPYISVLIPRLSTSTALRQGQCMEIKHIVSKAAENALRLAALFHLFPGKKSYITVEHLKQAIVLLQMIFTGARRLLE